MKTVNWKVTIDDAESINRDCVSAIKQLEAMLGPDNIQNAPREIVAPYIQDLKKYRRWKKSLEAAIYIFKS
jgi:uncharacterized membrane-anchored protein YjiN (DUF445 family)